MTQAPGTDQVALGPPATEAAEATPATAGTPDRLQLDDAEAGTLTRLRAVVEARPHAVAVGDPGGDLTYAELAVRAARVRAEVDARTAGTDRRLSPVALLPSHDAAGVTALLGVLASGHPLVVLDPSTPAPRLRRLLARCGARLCVTDAEHRALAGQVADEVLVPRTGPGRPLPPDAAPLWADPPEPTAVAVLAFTSGSTGEPKLVMNDHRMLVADAWANSLGTGCYDADDVVAHTLPLAFHAGLMVTVAGLLVGATLRMFDVRARGIAALSGWLPGAGATVMHASPGILRALVAARPDPEQLAGLRALTVAGEAVHGRDVVAVRPLLPPGCVLRNRYGSSETGLVAEYPVPAGHEVPDGPLPVGHPVGGRTVSAVDGVLTVTGRYLASGYWGDLVATEAAFTEHPDGSRTYRSSDLGRYAAGPGWTLLGRRDHSVKVRGYLVEPAEVDAALFALPEVREAVTVGLDREGGSSRLVSYVVSGATRPSAAGIRAALRAELPGYLVPESVQFLQALPRTERGKIDRTALPEPPSVQAFSPADQPITEWEHLVAQVWARALELEQVGRSADFFELGGDSLAAEAVISMAVSDLGVPAHRATTALLVEAPTVAQFAKRLRRRPGRADQTLTTLRGNGSRTPLFVVAGGGGLGVAFVPLSRHLDADQPVHALHSHALERRGRPDWSVRAAARRHLATLRTVQPRGPYLLAGHSFGGLVALELAHQLLAAGEQVDLLAILDSFPPDPALLPPQPSRSPAERVKDLAGLAVTGLVPHPGLGQYWRFHRQSQYLSARYRCPPYPGRTVVLVADSPDRQARSAWAPHLSGEWELRSVGGDHDTMIREPFAAGLAATLTELLARAGH